MQTYRILIFMAVWKRPEITEICFMGINRLRKSGLFPIEAFAVISEESMIPLCEKYDVKWCMHENTPVGKKKNFGLTEAYKLEWDYLLEIGSDDLLKTEVLAEYQKHLGKELFIGLDRLVFLNTEDQACRMFKTRHPFGLGRCFKREVFEKVGTRIWGDNINRGLDNNSYFTLAKNGIFEKRIISEVPLAIDIKSETNINPFNYLIGQPWSFNDTIEGLGEDEIEAINALQHAEVEG